MNDPTPHPVRAYTAFEGDTCLARGAPSQVFAAARQAIERHQGRVAVLVFDDATGQPVDVDPRGAAHDPRDEAAVPSSSAAEAATSEPSTRPRGRPRLGVVAREVTLLPRHWEWLNQQPGGASVALRKLVEAARNSAGSRDRIRRAQEAAYRFMGVLAGNQPGYEEALRALYAGDATRFAEHTDGWPADVRDHARRLAQDALTPAPQDGAGPSV
ncbi:DUF2239 family protein [Caldimonas brevitalea]|uniref:DUF2239 domain-containing protein n=1 Tax=Caldimonas brevitalea TaxID=413882 RepID=A0A0G3BLI2_9BURK|nr:DUF2239 family protein [Caldimonas brevitalea]AKJ27400.1 hypothetical protein AAW51_0709 [Caldimonas brevitalea]